MAGYWWWECTIQGTKQSDQSTPSTKASNQSTTSDCHWTDLPNTQLPDPNHTVIGLTFQITQWPMPYYIGIWLIFHMPNNPTQIILAINTQWPNPDHIGYYPTQIILSLGWSSKLSSDTSHIILGWSSKCPVIQPKSCWQSEDLPNTQWPNPNYIG